jgi:UDP-sulfoquinovose synthase
MRIFIAGIDGYLGWTLAQHLASRGHELGGADFFFRRRWVEEVGSWSALPIRPMNERLHAFKARFGRELAFWEIDLREFVQIREALMAFRPEAIVHLGECPSAPYSMIDAQHAIFVQTNNIATTFSLLFAIRELDPTIHLVKLGTMGEYGTPGMDIPEGFFEVEFRGRRDRLPFPRQAGSWYHWSKVHGSNNIMFACRLWDLRATDVMQGVVFGTRAGGVERDERFVTRFDFDEAFGTVINRLCCQAVIGHPLTLYGKGQQRRGFIALRDSMQCLALVLEQPPCSGEYRVVNQFERVCDISELASKIKEVAANKGLDAQLEPLDNPRMEAEDHYYNPSHETLLKLGFHATRDFDSEISEIIDDLVPYRHRIEAMRHVFTPKICWNSLQRCR